MRLQNSKSQSAMLTNLPSTARSAQTQDAYEIVAPAHETGQSFLPAPGNAFRVLIMEDEAMIGLLLETVLEELGFEVCAIEATQTGAVAAAARCNPQLMIVDARLREGSGILAVKLINRARFIPHVFVSGDKLTDYSFDPRAVVLQKPFLDAELARAIRRALGT